MQSAVPADPNAGNQSYEALCKLPVFRPVATQLMALLANSEPDILEIVELLRSDPGFSAELLTASNSAAFGPPSRVNTVQKAILVLGTERTRKLVVRTALQGMVRGMQEDSTIKNCWIHSRAAAALAEWLAPHYQMHPDRAHTLALMHDIGRLGLLSAHGYRYGELLEQGSGKVENLLDAERALFSIDHCQAGEWLAKTWGLPAEFQQTACTHHQKVKGLERDGNDLTACACSLAHALGFRSSPRIEGLPVEALLERLPARSRLVAQHFVNDLTYLISKELRV